MWSTQLHAQVYPVNGNAALIPPYSVYLADYTSRATERLMVNVVLNDVTRPELRVRLRVRIESQNIRIETKPEYIGSEIILQGGVPLRLSGTDLIEYFTPNNLNFSGITRREFEKTGALPQGFYQFCFEVLEYNRGVKISNTICAPAWLILNDPPLVNLPRNGEKLKPTVPQNLIFQWTPRHTGSPNSAFATEYEIEMVEIWPANRNPNDAMLSSPRILETTTRSTTFIYGPAETPLELGRQYALRIKAKSIVGVEEFDLFKNNGYSEVVTFVYGDACDIPENIRLETGATKFKVTWDGKFNHSAYTFRYRQAGTTNWYESNTAINEVNIYSLNPNTTYEYQIAGTCGVFNGEYSPLASLKTNDTGEASYSCGLPMETFNLDPTQLMDALKVGDVIQAGDFEVKLAKVSGGNGTFTGEGVIEVPFFNKASVKAEFTNISVNKEMRMVSGLMNVTGAGVEVIPSGVMNLMDELSQSLSSLDSALTNIENNLPQPFDENVFVPDTTLTVPGPVIVVKNQDGSVTVTDGNGNQHTLPPGTEAAIIDDTGKGHLVDSKGKVHEVSGAVATAAANREYNLKLTFSEADNSHYGFDAKKYDELASRYDKVDGDYFVPYKSVEVGRNDNLIATLEDGSIDKSKIRFEMGGVPVTATPFSGQSSTVTVIGKADGEQETLIAILPSTDDAQKDQVLGRANVVSYNAIHKNLVIVPVNGNTYSFGSAQTLQTKLNEIYSQAVVSWSVSITEGITVDGVNPFDVGATGMLTNYTDHMKKVINAYKDNMNGDDDTHYLFLVSNPTDAAIAGFMPRSKQSGFIFKDKHNTEEGIVRTIAHELGHGAFNLHHTFMEENLSVPEKKTDNLMDYAGGTRLYKYQWDMMRYPPIVVGLFESDEEAQYKSWSMLEGDVIAQIPGLENKPLLFLSPTCEVISLPQNTRDFTFNRGYLTKFTIENERYVSLNETSSKKFKGYFFNATQKTDGKFDISEARPYVGKIESTSNLRIIYALKKEGSCSEFSIFSAAYLSQLNTSETNGGIDAIVDFSKDITKIDNVLSQHTSIGTVNDRINCLNGRAKELYKFIIDHYAAYQQPLSTGLKDSLLSQIARFTTVFIDGLDTIPSVPSQRIKMREMLSYGVVEFIGRLENKANEVILPTPLVVEFEDFERYRDTYLVYQIAKKLDVDCALAEKIRDEIDRQLVTSGEVEFSLEFFTAVGKTVYEFYSMNELFELLNCLLKNLRAPESLYNPNRLDYQFQGFILMLFERYIKIDPNSLTANIPLELLRYNFACSCGVWNSLVDLVYGLSETGSGLTQNPIDLSNKVNEFFISISENGVGPMGSAVWDLIKEHHGYSEIVGFDSYQATYSGCYDVVFVASFFVGIGEVKAISEAKSLGEVGVILAKSAKAYPAAIKQIISWTARLSNKAARNLVLELMDRLPPGLYLQLPADLKAIHIATALNEGIRIASLSEDGIRILVSVPSTAGRTEVVFKSNVVFKNADNGTEGLLTIVKLENGTYAGFLDEAAGLKMLPDDVEFNALTKDLKLPGSQLPERVALTFENGVYANRQLTTSEKFYKYHGVDNRTGKKYSWLVKSKYNSENELRAGLAIREDWGVKIEYVTEFNVPADTWVSEGNAAAQGIGYPGGDYQAVITNLPDAQVIRTDPAFLVNGVGKVRLLSKVNNFVNLRTWINTLDDVSDVGLISKLDGLDVGYYSKLDADLVHLTYGPEIKALLKESPDDLTDVWKRLKDDPAYSWELQKTGGNRWEKWGQREFFKDVTAKGKGFERDVCLTAFRNRSSTKYLELKNKVSTDFGKNLDDYDLYSQVQLKYDGGDYFVADQLFVKYKTVAGQRVVDDVIIIENKLSSSTPLTTPQSNAFQQTSFTVRSQSVPSEFGSGVDLTSGKTITFSNSKQLYKVYDGENGDMISGIQKMQ